MSIRTVTENGLEKILIENDFISAVFLPSLGSKMIRLVNRKTGTQFLLEPNEKEKIISKPEYGEIFSEKYAYGFDECFPTVAPTLEEFNLPGSGFPDHGELWSLPWEYKLKDDKILFWISGIKSKYIFEKTVSLSDNKLVINYSLQNQSNDKINYLWCAHPLLNVKQGDRVILPKEANEILLDSLEEDENETSGEIIYWPYLDKSKREVDYSEVQKITFGKAIKCFTGKLKRGYAGLFKSDCNETVLFSFNPDKIGYLGIWLCYGGWPTDSNNKQLTVALEPTSGRSDSLVKAIRRNEGAFIDASKMKSWELEISLWEGLPEVLAEDLGRMTDHY